MQAQLKKKILTETEVSAVYYKKKKRKSFHGPVSSTRIHCLWLFSFTQHVYYLSNKQDAVIKITWGMGERRENGFKRGEKEGAITMGTKEGEVTRRRRSSKEEKKARGRGRVRGEWESSL